MAGPVQVGGAPRAPAAPAAGAIGSAPPAQAGRSSFLDRLKGTVVGQGTGASPPPLISIRGNKGVKTIAAVAVGIEGTPGLPLPEGTGVKVVSFDHQTEGSLEGHYEGDEMFAKANVEVVPILRALGYDPGNTQTAKDVTNGFLELLRHYREEKSVGLLVVDRFDLFTEQILKVTCHAYADKPLHVKLEPSEWGVRSNLIIEVLQLLTQAVADGGYVILTGEKEVNEGQEKLTNIGGRWVTAPVESKWIKRIDHALTVKIDVERALIQGTENHYVRHGLVTESRNALFPLGARVALNKRHVGAFQDKEALQLPSEDDLVDND